MRIRQAHLVLWLSATALVSRLDAAAPRSLSLLEAVDLATQRDPNTNAARLVLARRELETLRANLNRFALTVDAQLDETYTRSDLLRASGQASNVLSTPDATVGRLGLVANLVLPVFRGFGIESAVDHAKNMQEKAAFDLEATRRAVALLVIDAYVLLQKQDARVEVERLALERMKQVERIAAARVDSGLSPPIDKNRATAERLGEEAVLIALHGDAQKNRSAFGVMLGITDDVVLLDALRTPASGLLPLEAYVNRAASEREELRGATKEIAAKQDGVRVAQSTYYPRLDVVGGAAFGNHAAAMGLEPQSRAEPANPFLDASVHLQAGARVSINLFDTLNTYTQVKDARYAEYLAAEQAQKLSREIEVDIKAAYFDALRLDAVLRVSEESDRVARENQEILKKRYESGDALMIEFLDAELARIRSERVLKDIQFDRALAHLRLRVKSGQPIESAIREAL